MAKIQCKMCGGMNELREGETSRECPYCGMLTTFPKIDTEQREQLYNRAEHFRQANNFDKAANAYEAILDLDGEDPEAWWGLLISKYGIEYVEDPASHERIPTCHRVQFDSILADPDYLNALKYAVGHDRDIYEKEAKRIAGIQKDILRISAQEKPYDVFICYKETTDDGTRTRDSVLAQDMYDQLIARGLRVFFARITLEDKLGQQYEPYIFAALNSAKVMLVVGLKKEYFEAVWVKNEWSRFLALKKKNRSMLLIPCYADMDAYDIPEELSIFQCQDMNKIGFMQDLIRGIMKVVKPERDGAKSAAPDASDDVPEIEKIKRRVSILLAQKDWEKAVSYCERRLDSNPENAELYFLICMLSHRIPDENTLRNSCCNILDDTNCKIALNYASPEQKQQFESAGRDAAVNFFLKKCMEEKNIADPALLARWDAPLKEDGNFQAALRSATPEREKEILQIQYDQADFFLDGIRQRLGVSSFEQSTVPLGSNESFQTVLKFASPERQKELQTVQAKQCEYHLGKCIKANHVSTEADLAQTESPLAEDECFKTALLCASPGRREELRRIQMDQVEFFLRKCMEQNQIASEAELPECPTPLNENLYFRLAVQDSTQEQRKRLMRIQAAQSDAFLRKCMEANHVEKVPDLAKGRTLLSSDPYFHLAKETAFDSRKKRLAKIETINHAYVRARETRRKILLAACAATLVIIVSILWINRLTIKAAFGDVETQYELAQRYEKNENISDYDKAIYWYRKAAEHGHAEAQFKLGNCSAYTEAVKWSRKAAEQGHEEAKKILPTTELIMNAHNGNAEAQYQLAQCYETGKGYGISENQEEAIYWYRKAAGQGHAEAQFKLATIHENGTGVEEDPKEAVKWYRLAAENGHAVAKEKLPAAELIMKANDGDVEAQYKLAQCCETGDFIGIPKDQKEAEKWYEKAAKAGYMEAQFRLAKIKDDSDTFIDYMCIYWYSKAAQQDNAEALKRLHHFAENLRNKYAQDALGDCYSSGKNIKDNAEAVKWYRKAAEQGLSSAQISLGLCYHAGRGVPRSESDAVYWLRKAAEQEQGIYKPARDILKEMGYNHY